MTAAGWCAAALIVALGAAGAALTLDDRRHRATVNTLWIITSMTGIAVTWLLLVVIRAA